VEERVARSPIAADYRPGELYLRELPPLQEVLEGLTGLGAVVVDGYVWLEDGPALGGHLYRALGEQIPVIGIAKNPLAVAGPCAKVLRGGSRKPLYVSAAGCGLEDAADRVFRMHGPHRIPTLVRRADQLSRAASS
jgi:deoxyribonuclease V